MNKLYGLLTAVALPAFFFIALATVLGISKPAHAFAGNYALDFDGVSDYVELDSANALIGNDWQTTKSVVVWLRPMSEPEGTTQATERLIVGDFPIWFGIYQSYDSVAGENRIIVWNNDGSDPLNTSTRAQISIDYQLGEWVHIALVHEVTEIAPNPDYDPVGDPDADPPIPPDPLCLEYLATAGTLVAYKNGVHMGSVNTGRTAWCHPSVGGIELRIGGAIGGGGNWERLFDGQIDEVSIWDNALDQEDVRTLMYRTLNGDESGLRAYYQMSNGSGLSLSDDSLNSFDGDFIDGYVGSPVAPPDGDTAAWVASGAFAGPRNALAFDGLDNVVALNANTNTILGVNWASGKTAELWAYPTGTAPSVGSAAAGDILIGNAHWGIARADIGGADRLWLYNNDGNEERVGIPYASGEWAHLALVHAGGSLNAYKNGALVGSVSSGNTANDADLLIGSGFAGQLDELRLWNSALSAQQIRENMFQTVRHNETGLAAYYRFDQQNDASVTTVYDTAVSSHHGTMTNMDPANNWVASTAFNTWIGSQSSAWADGTNWSRYAAPTASDNVGLYNYPASNPPQINGSSVANSVLIATGATLTVNSGGSLRADGLWFNFGALANEGTLEQRQAVDGSAPVQFFADGNYGPITINSNSFDLGGTTVRVRALANCTAGGPEQTVQRCIDIAPDNSPGASNPSTLTFSFLDGELNTNACNTLNAFHWNGSGWDTLTVDSRQCNTEPYSLQVSGVTDFSPFMLTSENSPTAVRLNGLGVGETAVIPVALLLLALILLLPTTRLLNGRRQTG